MWIFGWDRVPAWAHLASIWTVAVAVNVSAYFIIVANSFMQHPVGAEFDAERGRATLVDLWALLSNPTALQAFPHAMAGGWILAGTLVAGVSGWWMIRTARAGDEHGHAAGIWRSLTRFGSWIILLGTAAVAITGDALGKLMFIQQPMKMASAEALCHTETDPNFSILAFSRLNNCETAQHLIDVPYVLSFLAEGKFSGVELRGVTELQQYLSLIHI